MKCVGQVNFVWTDMALKQSLELDSKTIGDIVENSREPGAWYLLQAFSRKCLQDVGDPTLSIRKQSH